MGSELWKLEPRAEYEEYLVVTRWDPEEAHLGWTRSEEFKAAHVGPRADLLVGHPQVGDIKCGLCRAPWRQKCNYRPKRDQ